MSHLPACLYDIAWDDGGTSQSFARASAAFRFARRLATTTGRSCVVRMWRRTTGVGMQLVQPDPFVPSGRVSPIQVRS